jgi:PAS domain S-box-containing protein
MGKASNHPQKKQDESDRKPSRERESEAYYRKITDNTPVIIWITNPDGQCTYLNRQWYEYTGNPSGTGLGFEWLETVHPDDKKQSEDIFLKANKRMTAFDFECRFKARNGEYRWNIDSGLPKFDDQGNFEGFIGSVIDIHKRKLTEEALRKSESWYKTYAEAMPQMAFIADAEGNIIYFNKRWYEYIGGMEGTEGWGWKDKPIHHPDDLKGAIDMWNNTLRTGDPYEVEYRLRRYDGEYRWHLGRAMPIRNKEGKIELWLGTNTDIHKQKQAEEALMFEREKLQAIIENMGVGVGVTDSKGTTLSLNKTALQIHGFQKESEMLDQIERYREMFDLQYPDGSEMPFEEWPSMRAMRGERVNDYEVKLINRIKQSQKYISYTVVPIYDSNGLLMNFIFTLTDLTDRKRAEEKLNFQKSLLEAQQEVSPLGNLVVSSEGKMLTYNSRMREMWHFPEEIMNTELDEIALNIAKEQLIDPEEFVEKVMACYERRVHNHEKLYFKDGRIFDRYGAPVNDENGTYYGYVWFFMDITEQENLARQKDDFLGIASHELKTPVAIMKGYVNLLERQLRSKDVFSMEADLLKKADNQIVRLTNLINNLLDVTKLESGKMKFEQDEFDFDQLTHEVVESMQHMTTHKLVQRGKTGKIIIGDKDRTGQAINNLISNAVKYSPKTTEIIIETWASGKEVFLHVKDRGIGIATEDLSKVFDRFFRVRTSGNHSAGLGLGLFISSEIIKRQNGKIWVESKEGEGSVFGFSLPTK